ncbi:MAG: histidine kinase dimerization/phospho-acceptor domain-containing protein, partial [Cyanobacteria bacterium P01_F01_bin.86]
MDSHSSTPPQSPQQNSLSRQTKGWLSRLKVGRKITLSYAVALGVAVIGTVSGIAIGNRYEQRAYAIQQDAIGEILELKDLESSLTQLRVNERDLVTWLDDPQQFQATYRAYRENVREFQESWAELLEEYEEDAEEGIEREEELEFLENLIENYNGVLGPYLQEVDSFIEDLNFSELQGIKLSESRQALIEFNRRPVSLKLTEFSDELSKFVESIEAIELEEANEVVEAAAQIRLQIMGVSILLSLIIAGLLASLISQAITKPLKSLKETALQVTQDENFNLRAVVESSDEVGSLGLSVNQLIAWIGEYTRSLKLAQRELESKTQELNAIIDNLGDGLLVVSPQGYITRSNPSFRQMLNLANTSLIGKPVAAVLDPQITDLVNQKQPSSQNSFSAELELTANRVGQALVTRIMPEATIDPLLEELKSAGSVVLIRDITAEKEIDQMKTDFISTVSHELRTPLTSVLGFAKLIQKKLEGIVLPAVNVETPKTERAVRQVKENLDIIVAEGERLTSLINDVLDIAKIEAGKIEWNMQPLVLSDIVDRAMAATSILAEHSGLEIIRDIEGDIPTLMGDRDRLIQVVINLLSNAIKFTTTGSVTCRIRQQADTVLVSVIDTGIGLAPEDMDQVFEKFKQVG